MGGNFLQFTNELWKPREKNKETGEKCSLITEKNFRFLTWSYFGQKMVSFHSELIPNLSRTLLMWKRVTQSSVGLPDNSKGNIDRAGYLTLHPQLSPSAQTEHIVDNLTNTSLISAGQLCDDNCIVTFNKTHTYVFGHISGRDSGFWGFGTGNLYSKTTSTYLTYSRLLNRLFSCNFIDFYWFSRVWGPKIPKIPYFPIGPIGPLKGLPIGPGAELEMSKKEELNRSGCKQGCHSSSQAYTLSTRRSSCTDILKTPLGQHPPIFGRTYVRKTTLGQGL